MAEQEEPELTVPPQTLQNIHLHVEQVSLKTKGKLAERPFYNQDCEKHPHAAEQEGKRSGHIRTCVLRRGHKRVGGHTGSEIFPGERAAQTTLLGTQPWGPTLGGCVSLGGLQTSRTDSEAVRNLEFIREEHTRSGLLPKQGRGSGLEVSCDNPAPAPAPAKHSFWPPCAPWHCSTLG